ncbi:arylamine N-acetyltransferase [Rapidithrix thailandica]|uniref:Arylamine N-acetyltransferase n=1 Tax=Rapidithrix thailandica TaxID=413964 RepID=A0AAW9S986_9BACT
MKTKLQQYFDRIGFTSHAKPDLETLHQLHLLHLTHIPFENLDVMYHNPISLEPEKLFKKLVEKKRGGFCYEMNGLFQQVLQTIGFDSHLIAARVKNSQGGFGREDDHAAILTILDGNIYLTDVGFGDSFLKPILLETGTVTEGKYTITEYDDNYLAYSSKNETTKQFETQFIFTLQERPLSYFTEGCEFHQTSPDSHFTKGRVITLAREDGRVTLSESKLKISQQGKVTEFPIHSEKTFSTYLKEYFHLNTEQLID